MGWAAMDFDEDHMIMNHNQFYPHEQQNPGKPWSNTVDDEFQKAQCELLVDHPAPICVQEVQYPSDGQLMPLDFRRSEMDPAVVFQGNNNNEAYHQVQQQDRYNYQCLESLDFQRNEPKSPASNTVLLEKAIQREKNKIYSANSLKKKKTAFQNAGESVAKLQKKVEEQSAKNAREEHLLNFAFYNVLLAPSSNSLNNEVEWSGERIEHFANALNEEKRRIELSTEETRLHDAELIEKVQKLAEAEKMLAEAEYNLKNKHVMAAQLGIAPGTFGSRRTRAKDLHQYCDCEYLIVWNRHELVKLQRLNKLLNEHWSLVRPSVCEILETSGGVLAARSGQIDAFRALYHFLALNPG
ncbi:unnamed protein product [Caenorhabditis sp. 36 PRJEB53466]|nr:unnamed protein product [Caenorhabditis sp. 36 PRJEB53466]